MPLPSCASQHLPGPCSALQWTYSKGLSGCSCLSVKFYTGNARPYYNPPVPYTIGPEAGGPSQNAGWIPPPWQAAGWPGHRFRSGHATGPG